ncbi:hypothetical protein C0992_011855 [Termitomyces sp. T32_za158]|nr:hypothetical protein C0992_011855 [Termitomyces sp. T32_za158]
MPPPRSEIWKLFYPGTKQNGSHLYMHCLGCLEKHHPDGEIMELDSNEFTKLSFKLWVIEACKNDVGGVLGVKNLMIAHILGKNGSHPCPNASAHAQKMAKALKKRKEKRSKDEVSESEADDEKDEKKPKKLLTKVKASMKQFHLKLSHGINIPFTPKQEKVGKYAVLTSDEWKDESRNAVTDVNLSVDGKTYLVNLILANSHKKDGNAMCHAFEGMIDKAEEVYSVYVVALCCDNNGDSQHRRKNVVSRRQWLFSPPCYAHQFQLTAGDYFLVNEEGAVIAEKATNLIGWILNHGLVHSIFDAVQSANSRKILAFLIANMTHWNTHFIAFDHLQDLKTSLQLAVFMWRNNIIAAQVGAKKNQKKKRKLSDDATQHCDMIEDGGFWRGLKDVIDDLEPICLGLNMNQTNLMRPDQTYRRIRSRPPKVPWTDVEKEIYQEVKLQKEKEVSEAFFSYLSERRPFEDWEKNKKTFLQINLEKMAKVGANIRALHKDAGLVGDRAKRQNHEKEKAAELLVVPRYADLLKESAEGNGNEQDGADESRSSLVKFGKDWQKEMAK